MDTTNLQLFTRDTSGVLQTTAVTSVNKILFGSSGTLTGLNVYRIIPKVKQYVMSGTYRALNNILAGNSSSGQLYYDAIWGKSSIKQFKVITYITTGQIYYEYVDSFGNEGTNAVPFSGGVTFSLTPNNIVGINRAKYILNYLQDGSFIDVHYGSSSSNNILSISKNYYNNAVITCPNNAIMYVSNITTFLGFPNVTGDILLLKFDGSTGASKVVFKTLLWRTSDTFSAGPDGSIGGYMYPGDAVAMAATAANKETYIRAFANVVIKYLS